jgi:hypothetical protein
MSLLTAPPLLELASIDSVELSADTAEVFESLRSGWFRQMERLTQAERAGEVATALSRRRVALQETTNQLLSLVLSGPKGDDPDAYMDHLHEDFALRFSDILESSVLPGEATKEALTDALFNYLVTVQALGQVEEDIEESDAFLDLMLEIADPLVEFGLAVAALDAAVTGQVPSRRENLDALARLAQEAGSRIESTVAASPLLPEGTVEAVAEMIRQAAEGNGA